MNQNPIIAPDIALAARVRVETTREVAAALEAIGNRIIRETTLSGKTPSEETPGERVGHLVADRVGSMLRQIGMDIRGLDAGQTLTIAETLVARINSEHVEAGNVCGEVLSLIWRKAEYGDIDQEDSARVKYLYRRGDPIARRLIEQNFPLEFAETREPAEAFTYEDNRAAFEQGWGIFNYDDSRPPKFEIQRTVEAPEFQRGQQANEWKPRFNTDAAATDFVNDQAKHGDKIALKAVHYLADKAMIGQYRPVPGTNLTSVEAFHRDFPDFAHLA